ncbi:MAG: GNAT family N-acetyltransferase [Myxococcales bacterium]|nr:GNAT family N-acetyltransferase [Myxococcales bacterium]
MRAVLFDMDGVLVRSEEVWFRVVEAAGVRFRGRAITRDEFFPTFGQGTAADVPVFGLSCSVAELDAFYVSEFIKHLDAMWVNPEAAPLAEALTKRGLRIGIVTNTVAPLARAILEHAKLATWFEVRATADRVEHAKPAPDLVLLGLKELGVSAADAVMIGDSRFDREAARAAGVRFIGLKLDGDGRIERLGDLPVELGWSSAWRLRVARAGDEGEVESLLGRLSLPLDGLRDLFPAAYVVAVEGSKIVGVAGLERHGHDGLLRSVAVEPRLQRTGLGAALVDERLAEARKQGLQSVSLLTTTAREYFLTKGFHDAPREAAAPAVAKSIEFTKACPSAAAHLVWRP